MSAENAVELYALFEANGIDIWVDGGWGVDALIARERRPHADLDIVIEERNLPPMRDLLEVRGFQDIMRDDSRAWNFVLGDRHGRIIDVHAVVLDEHGNGIYGPPEEAFMFPAADLQASGTIAGRAVRCLSAEFQVRSHSGYDLKEKDYSDVRALCDRFAIPYPFED